MVARYEGYNGTITIDGPTITINRSGVAAKLSGHLMGDRVLPLAALTAVNMQEPTVTTNGHLQMAFGGQPLVDLRRGAAPGNANTIVFTRRQREAFTALAGFLTHVVEVNRANGIDSASSYATAADPLVAAQLREQEAAAAKAAQREERQLQVADRREQMKAARQDLKTTFDQLGQDFAQIGDDARAQAQAQAVARAEASQRQQQERAARDAATATERAEKARQAEEGRQQAAAQREGERAARQEQRAAQQAARDEARTAKLASKIGDAAERPDIMAAAARMNRTFGGKREIKNLPQYLHEGERVLMLAQGTYDTHDGIIALTDQRVIFLFQGIINTEMHDYPHRTIASVRTVGRLSGGDLVIQASGGNVVIRRVISSDLQRMAEAIRAAVTSYMAPLAASQPGTVTSTAGEPDTFDQIRKLSELHAAGILTDEEFQAKKQQLLDRL